MKRTAAHLQRRVRHLPSKFFIDMLDVALYCVSDFLGFPTAENGHNVMMRDGDFSVQILSPRTL